MGYAKEAPYASQGISAGATLGFAVAAILALSKWQWPTRWLISGTPFLSFALLLGASNGYRVLEAVPLTLLILSLNIVYAIAST